MLETLPSQLSASGLQFQICNGQLPSCTIMHNMDHETPLLIIWPRSTEEVQIALKIINPIREHYDIPLSVMSGGHGYDGKAMCKGITFDMQLMNDCQMEGVSMKLQPGCGLRKVMDVLQKNNRIIPHGDSLTVGAGGHFISAGWDLVLTRTYGLGCQHVQSAEMVYWDGTVEYITPESNPEQLHAIKGSFGGFKGIVTSLSLKTFPAPREVHLARVVLEADTLPADIIERSYHLPPAISSTFRFFYQEGKPVLVLILGTLMSKKETILALSEAIGTDYAKAIDTSWVCESLSDVRFLPLNYRTQKDWESIVEMTTEEFEEVAEQYWKRDTYLREMKVSYCQQRSYWVDIHTPKYVFDDIRDFLYTIKPGFQERVYGNITIGGGHMWENRAEVSMPIGKAIMRFECHSDNENLHHTLSKEIADHFSDLSAQFFEPALIGQVYSGDEFKS